MPLALEWLARGQIPGDTTTWTEAFSDYRSARAAFYDDQARQGLGVADMTSQVDHAALPTSTNLLCASVDRPARPGADRRCSGPPRLQRHNEILRRW